MHAQLFSHYDPYAGIVIAHQDQTFAALRGRSCHFIH